jgi:protein-arginine kinase activator protein McsA
LRPATALALGILLAVTASYAAQPMASDMYRPPGLNPGGVNPHPWITGLVKTGATAQVSWYGLPGTYHLLESAQLAPTHWTNVGDFLASDCANSLTLTNQTGPNGFFRLHAVNNYVGQGGCRGCHGDVYATWSDTPHATALNTLNQIGMGQNKSCIPCHTVGFGQPTGYTDMTNTPHLANVGCETCHGPAAAHKYGDHELVHPAVTVAAEVCGGCHTDAHHPTYDEWKESPHGEVTPELQVEFADPVGGPARQMACGACHSGAVRMAMLANYKATRAGWIAPNSPLVLPSLSDAGHFSPTCVVCHDPHQTNSAAGFQLRNPLFSTNFYSFSTATVLVTNVSPPGVTNTYYANTGFNSQYDLNLQVCAQCHNQRGALWTSSSRPPHHSPQYNMLLGNIGTLNTTNRPSPHGLQNTNQCIQCHMQRETPDNITEENPAYTGHGFQVLLGGCVIAGCHSSTNLAGNLIYGTQHEITNSITEITGLLNTWATTKAPLVLRTNYGKLAWEYTNPGALGNPTANPSLVGPTAAQQALVPNTIKQARFYLYIVFHDASLGAHNAPYARFLLNTAKANIQATP